MASQIYVAGKMKACSRAGIKFELIKMPAKTTQNKLEKTIKQLNDDKEVTGILLQLPLPHHLNSSKALNCILPDKDVDGLTDINLGRLFVGDTDGLIPCTPRGVMLLLGRNNIAAEKRKVFQPQYVSFNPKLLVCLSARHSFTGTNGCSFTSSSGVDLYFVFAKFILPRSNIRMALLYIVR